MPVKDGDTVKVHYTLKLTDGEKLESTIDASPMEFKLGEGKMIPGFEKEVIGMEPGESKTINILSDDAYGSREEKKVFELPKAKAPQGFDPQIGQTVRMHRPDGNFFPVTVVEITEKGYKMDANHPLAGKNLTFELELVELAG